MDFQTLSSLQSKSIDTGLPQRDLIELGIRLVCAVNNGALETYRKAFAKRQREEEELLICLD